MTDQPTGELNMPRVTVEYYGVEGTGKNVTEAKRDAGEKIKQALDGHYTPTVLVHKGYAILVYRSPFYGWASRIIVDAETGVSVVREGDVHGGSGRECRKTAIADAYRHLAQLGWKHGDSDEPPEFLTDRADRTSFKEWVEFQVRYRVAIDRGMGSNDAHSYALRNPQRAELWTGEAA
jgi:hypothetical protein